MDEERKILIDVQIGDKNFDQQIGEVNSELEENRKIINELKKDYKENATEIANLEARNRQLAKSKQTLIKESQTESNSLDALRLRLAKLTAERNKTDTSTKEGAARFKELQKEIKATSDEVKGFEEQGGDFRRNIGNYISGIGGMAGAFVNLFKVLLTNPIGLILTALAGLVKLFSETQTGQELFRKGSAFLSTTLGKLRDVVEEVGKFLISAFENPQETLTSLIDTIQNGIVNYFTKIIPSAIERTLEGFSLLGEAFSALISGEFSKAGDLALEGIAKVADGATDLNPVIFAYKEITKAVIDFAIEANAAANAAIALETAMIANEKALANLAVTVARNKVEFIQLKTASDDVTKSTRERIEAAQAAFDLENKTLQEQIRLQQERVNILKAQNDLTNSTEEDLQRVRDAEIALFTLQEASLNKQLEIRNKLNGLIQQQSALEQAQADKSFNARAELAIFEAEQADQLVKAEIARRNLLLLNDQLTEDERVLIKAKSAAKIKEINKKAADDAIKIAKAEKDAKIAAEQGLLAAVGSLFEQGTELSKAAAIAQIAFSTGRAIAEGIAASQSVPFPGNLIAIVTTLTAILTGIGQAKAALSQGSSASVSSSPTTAQVPSVSPGLSSVNASLLSQFGQPARDQQQQAEDVVEGVRNLPQSVVLVSDINKGQSKVAVKESEASL